MINLCEIKYCSTPFVINKNYAARLQAREQCYREITNTKKQIFLTMITSNGLQPTLYSDSLIDSTATLEDLFSP